jgi:D-aminopeptidase
MANGSGDFVVAFSTAEATGSPEIPNGLMSPLFLAVVEAVEEAVYNSLTKATAVTGWRGHTADAIPLEKLRGLLAVKSAGPGR